MIDIKLKILFLLAIGVAGIPLVFYSCLFLLPLYSDFQSFLEPNNIFTLVFIAILISVWAYALVRTVASVLHFYHLGSYEKKSVKELKKKRESLELFKKVAVQEYYKKRITKDTLDEILKIYGKEMVEAKARLKEIEKKKK